VPTLELSTGNSLAYEHLQPERGDGVTFVCFNALTGDKGVWESSIGPALTDAGHGLLTWNLRGQAGSAFTSQEFDEACIVADAEALLHHTAPAAPVYVGLSIGGLFAARAHLQSAPARGLVFINTLRRDGPRLRWLNDAVLRAVEVGGLDMLRDLYTPLLFNEEWQRDNRANFLKAQAYKPLDPGDGSYLLLKSGGTADWNIPLEDINVPVLNVTGLQDRLFYDADDVDALIARLPDAQRVDMENAGHMVPAERPKELARALIGFADRCRTGA